MGTPSKKIANGQSKDFYLSSFKKIFSETARYHHRSKVFDDFVAMSAFSIANTFYKSDELEQSYMDIVRQYEKEDANKMAELLACVTLGLNAEMYTDMLGGLYMSLDLGDVSMGQFFTPDPVALMMAQVNFCGFEDVIAEKRFVTCSDCCAGAGGLPIAQARVMFNAGFNPQTQLWVHCIDVDNTAANMCYIQMSLYHLPACISYGNALSWSFRKHLYTPAHFVGLWDSKLRYRREEEAANSPSSTNDVVTQSAPVHSDEHQLKEPSQVVFDF